MRYELCYLVGASREMDLPKVKEEVMEVVASLGGVFEEKEFEEKRKMAYKVKHETHGIYVAKRFELEDSEKLTEIIEKLNLYSQILRFLISRADELPELVTKEERLGEAASKDKVARAKEAEREKKKTEAKPEKSPEKIEKPEIKEEPKEKEETGKEPEVKLPKEDDKKKQEEDLDKKLEEILNI